MKNMNCENQDAYYSNATVIQYSVNTCIYNLPNMHKTEIVFIFIQLKWFANCAKDFNRETARNNGIFTNKGA